MIKIICIGKLKEKYLKEAVEEYTKRITKYSKIEIIELQDYDYDNEEINKTKEKEQIIKHISNKDYIITLEIDGNMLTSKDFASKIDNALISNSNITFIIGGSYGLSDEIKSLSNYALSFSKMTFPHQLFRVVLLEQIYRAFKINKNESYHK